jgi:hypothetical protein
MHARLHKHSRPTSWITYAISCSHRRHGHSTYIVCTHRRGAGEYGDTVEVGWLLTSFLARVSSCLCLPACVWCAGCYYHYHCRILIEIVERLLRQGPWWTVGQWLRHMPGMQEIRTPQAGRWSHQSVLYNTIRSSWYGMIAQHPRLCLSEARERAHTGYCMMYHVYTHPCLILVCFKDGLHLSRLASD